MTGREPIYERIHGGVEIGIIAGAIPDMDAVGYAPTSHGAHTADEYLLISTVQPFWDVLTDVLSKKEKT
jgi:dipeptidase D